MTSSAPIGPGDSLAALLSQASPDADASLALARELYQAGRFADAERLAAHAVAAHPDARDLWNIRGVALRVLRRHPEALEALTQALRIDPAFTGALVNLGNVRLDVGDGAGALDAFSRLLALDPVGAMPRALLGRALLRLGRADEAVARFREAVAIKPDYVEAWLSIVSAFNDLGRPDLAEQALTEGLAANPDQRNLLEAKALLLRVNGRRRETETFLIDLLSRLPEAAWIHLHLGDLLAVSEPDRATTHLRRALALEPTQPDHVFALLRALGGSVTGDEGAKLDEAYQLCRRIPAGAGLKPAQTALLRDVYARTCAFAELDALGSFEALGDGWAGAGLNAALMYHLSRADTPAKLRALVAQHRQWGQAVEARAARTPITPPSPRSAGGKVRLGLMSSDLRNHPVGSFALPILDHIDRERFEVFVYSFYRGPADGLQTHVQNQVDAFRWWPEVSARDAAQQIAVDGLDMLIELGGPTNMNMPEVLAWRPARRQASWLGYPHSTGLSAVDDYICDPHNQPTAPGLLIEQPLLMPRSWIAMSPALVARSPEPARETPEQRKGHLTYGTANNPYKFTPAVLAAWARIVAATPGAHFAIVRPEGGSQVFRRNVEAAFAAEGVAADRLDWHVVRGGHMAAYEAIDISLDTFPLTGGTTTVEALLMGVPVVSLAGQAVFERLSRSILINAGLGDLCVDAPADYDATALRLAGDPARRLALRRSLRADLQASPLGQTEAFARDFYDMIYKAVRPDAA